MTGAKAPLLPTFRVSLSPGFVLLAGLVFFLDQNGLVSALIPAAVIHELGHMAALLLLDAPPRTLRATASGLFLDYAGELTLRGRLTAALAGPLAGLAASLIWAKLGAALESRAMLSAAGISFLLSIFNLLPVMPLDGGRALLALLERFWGRSPGKRVLNILGLFLPAAALAAGLFFPSRAILSPAAVWLLANNLFHKKPRTFPPGGLVKKLRTL